MKGKLWRFAALLPSRFLTARHQRAPQHIWQPSAKALRRSAELRQRMQDHATAINDLASHIQTLKDARKLVDLIAVEFSNKPPIWARFMRDHIARVEFKCASGPDSLIPEQHIADVWNDFVKKIGAPQETVLNAAEIHYLRDARYVSARVFWTADKQIWTMPAVFAVGADGKVANGSRALEAITLLWLTGQYTDDFASIHEQVRKGVLFSDSFSQQDSSRERKGYVTVRTNVSYPIQTAASQYIREHGKHSFNRVIEDLLKDLLNG